MAHDIAEINGRAAMAYQGEMPWHQLGQQMPEKANVQDALKAASLDWNVEKEPIYLKDDVAIQNRFAVVRDVDREVLGIVSDEYFPVPNEKAFGVLNTACDRFSLEIESAGALGRGEKVWMLAKMPESIEPIPGDKVNGYFCLMTGHNGTTPLIGRPTPVRVVCANTLNIAFASGEDFVRLLHLESEMSQLKQFEKLIADLTHALTLANETFAELAAKKLEREQVVEYINSVLYILADELNVFELLGLEDVETKQTRQAGQILQLVYEGKGARLAGSNPDGSSTAWAAYNGVTEFVDHVLPATSKSDSGLARANKSAIFGKGSKMKTRALSLAVAL